jgi:hypothetical protein
MSDTFDAAAHAAGEAAPAPETEQVTTTAAPEAETADQITEAPATSEEDTPADPNDAPETPSRGDKRVQQLLQERHQLRERMAYLEGMAQRQQAPADPVKQAAPQLPQDVAQWVGAEPTPDTFPAGEFDPQYLRAVARFEARSEHAQFVVHQRQQAAMHAEQAKAQSFIEAADKVAVDKPDFREVVGRFGQTVHNQVANLIAEAGPEVAYAIAKDEQASARVRSAQSLAAVAREIGRIEERLARPSEKPSPQPTQAPEPPARTVRGGSVGNADPSRMPMSEYAAWSAKHMPKAF